MKIEKRTYKEFFVEFLSFHLLLSFLILSCYLADRGARASSGSTSVNSSGVHTPRVMSSVVTRMPATLLVHLSIKSAAWGPAPPG
jgi:hypothetical protein